ncbi:MAG: hypothetical protein FJ145_07225 [Deltaproteobacteria bacterium]|nr:hypothetical protein [Deltaproteobacteria bacterium]
MPVKILDHITVVECATFVTGRYATALLADLGARVIKIESPPEGETNPGLIYCSISAFGQTGPYAKKPGFDTLGQAMSGLLSLLSDSSDPKVMGMAQVCFWQVRPSPVI